MPPNTVSTLVMLTVLAKPPRVRVSLPAARSTEALESAAARVTVSTPALPARVSTNVLKVAELAATRDRPFCPSAWRGYVIA